MGRSIKKGPYVDANVETKVLAINDGTAKVWPTKSGVIVLLRLQVLITPFFAEPSLIARTLVSTLAST